MKTVSLFILLCCTSTVVLSVDETLARKGDEELAVLAVSENSAQRIAILGTLAMRYRQPGDIVIDSKIPVPPAHPKDAVISLVVLSNVLQVAESNQDIHSRIAAIDVLKALLLRTNITEHLQVFLHDSQVQMRLRACGALIEYAETKGGATTTSEVSDCLAGILSTANDPGTLTVASRYAARLGNVASNCVPALVRLKRSTSKEVRTAATQALKRIENEP